MRLSTENLNKVRQEHLANLHLSIFEPRIVFKARINNVSISRNTRVIDYDTVTLGSYLDILNDSTMLVGSQEGLDDVGKIRIRGATSSQITTAENSHINWQDGQHLTVLRFVEVWAIYPRIISNPNDPEDSIFYKDYDIVYTNQNEILGTLICAGPNRAGFLETGTFSTYYSATGTAFVGSSTGVLLSYHWHFEGGTPTGSNAITPGWVGYQTPGHYTTTLVVSGSNGSSDTAYRYVSVYDRPNEGTNTPILDWQLMDMSGSFEEGGYSAKIRVRGILDDLKHGSVVVIFSDNYYGNERINFGGNSENNSSLFFSGQIKGASIYFDFRDNYTDFEVVSVTEILKDMQGFSVSVEDDPNPNTWYKLKGLTVSSAIYHYYRWQSTLSKLADIQVTLVDRPLQYFDADRSSLYDALDSLLVSALRTKLVSDRQGKLWVSKNPENDYYATTNFQPLFVIEDQDYVGRPSIARQLNDSVSFVEYGGIAYSGFATGTFSPLLTNAPGDAPSYGGNVDRSQGLALINQEELNEIAGAVWSNRNVKYPRISMSMPYCMTNLDIAPPEALTANFSVERAGYSVTGSYIINDISWELDSENGTLVPSISAYALSSSPLIGQTIPVPPEADDAAGFQQPPATIPNIAPLAIAASVEQAATSRIAPAAVISFTSQATAGDISWTGIDFFGTESIQYFSWSILNPTVIRVSRSGVYLITTNFLINNTDTVAGGVGAWLRHYAGRNAYSPVIVARDSGYVTATATDGDSTGINLGTIVNALQLDWFTVFTFKDMASISPNLGRFHITYLGRNS